MEQKIARRFFALAIVLLAPPLANATERPLGLRDCVDLALGRSPDLQIVEMELQGADESIWAARAGLLPLIAGRLTGETLWGEATSNFSLLHLADENGLPAATPTTEILIDRSIQRSSQTTITRTNRFGKSITVTRPGPTTITNVTTTTTRTPKTQPPDTRAEFPMLGFGSVELSYPLFKDGSILGLNEAPAVGSAKAQKAALVWTKDLTREQVIFIVATSFLEAATRADCLRLDQRRVELTTQRLANMREQLRLGLKLATDVDFAAAQLRSSQQRLALSKQQDSAARMDLATLLGREARTLNVVSKLPPSPPLPAVDQLVAQAMAKHPGVGVQAAVVDQRNNDYRLARAQGLPQVALSTGYLHGVDLSAPQDQRLYTAMVTVDVPLFDFGATRARTRAAFDTYLAEKIRLTKVGEDIRRAIIDAYAALVILQASAADAERDAVQAETAFQLVDSQWRSGLVPPLGATDAELALLDKKEALNDLRQKELGQFATLQNAAGGVWSWLR
jgi:outer membrane protein